LRLVHGRAEARWMPSRHNVALFRLLAFLRLRLARAEERDVILFVDRYQSTFEAWAVGSWVMLTFTAYIAAELNAWLMLPVALVLSALLAMAALQCAVVGIGACVPPLWRAIGGRTVQRSSVNSFTMLFAIAAASAHYATSTSWVRFVAWQFGVMLALNGVAAAVVFLLREPIARLESSLGGLSSAL
jgi:hypothetical protein